MLGTRLAIWGAFLFGTCLALLPTGLIVMLGVVICSRYGVTSWHHRCASAKDNNKVKRLWIGHLHQISRASAITRLGLPRVCFSDNFEDHRLEAHDQLKAALRSTGMLGMGGRYALEVIAYDRKVKTVADLALLRDALSRLAAT